MTLHCAKGLEFSRGFIVGIEEDFCPITGGVRRLRIWRKRGGSSM